MPDFLSREHRSALMSRIRGRGNKETELALAKLLRRHGVKGWRRHQSIFGKPDFIFPKARLAVFVDGCFWHGCPKHGTRPKSNRSYWHRKLSRNKPRDKLVNRELQKLGWRVFRIWQHEFARQNESRLLLRLERALI
jgi:DNA mismatch endonuclease (patch repair protein)